MNTNAPQPSEYLDITEVASKRTFREKALRAVAGVGLVAAAVFAGEWTLDIGGNQSIGFIDSAKYAAEFGVDCALVGLSMAVINKTRSDN